MRYLGLDFGNKTIGLSVSDKFGIIASSYVTLRYECQDEAIKKIKEVIEDKKIEALVMGYPLNLDGSKSVRCDETLKFKDALEKETKLEVELQDERYSTTEAQKMLISNKTRRKSRKKVIDALASTIILQTYLDRKKNEK